MVNYVMPLLAQDYPVIAPDIRCWFRGSRKTQPRAVTGARRWNSFKARRAIRATKGLFLVGADLDHSIGSQLAADCLKAVRSFERDIYN